MDKNARILNAVCPYCGKVNKIKYDKIYDDAQIVYCDDMEGGCGKMFVADVAIAITVRGRKVVGEE